jgi:hypothetical protein
LIKKERNRTPSSLFFLKAIGQDTSSTRKQCGVCLIYHLNIMHAFDMGDDCKKSDSSARLCVLLIIERS